MAKQITHELTCINCPMGCMLTATLMDGTAAGDIQVTGNTCKLGEKYAVNELRAPVRMVTASIKLDSGKMLPVKTNNPIPKAEIAHCLEALKGAKLTPSKETIACGDVIIENILSLGIDMVATKSIYF